MAKTGFWLRGARGKFAGAAFQRGPKGSTVQREVVTPKNPKSRQQLIQRAIMATVMNGYSALKNICDHSFEGVTYGADSMYMFNKLNAKKLRAKVADAAAINQIAGCCAFTKLGSNELAPAEFILSNGSLPELSYITNYKAWSGIAFFDFHITGDEPRKATYQDVISQIGAQRGDQITFVALNSDLNTNKLSFATATVILDPINEDGTPADLSVNFTDQGLINKPNPNNTGYISIEDRTYSQQYFGVFIGSGRTVGSAVILSRKDGNDWLRSKAVLNIDYFVQGVNYTTILEAIASESSEIAGESDYLLNGATQEGREAMSTPSYKINNGAESTAILASAASLTNVTLVGCGTYGTGAAKVQEQTPNGMVDITGSWAVSDGNLVWTGSVSGTSAQYVYVTLMGSPVVKIIVFDDDGE